MDFAKGQRKDDVMHEYLAAFEAAGQTEGVLFIGRAQEKTPLFRTEKRRDRDGKSYPWIVKTTGMVNHFYFYCVDGDFGPFFLKFCSYFPYNAKLCINGNHWAQRQAAKAGIGVRGTGQRLRRGRATPPPCRGSAISWDRSRSTRCCANGWPGCRTRSPPRPGAGYRYDISILQAEFSLTQMLDKPVSGRVFFEQVIRDNLDAGRPDQVSLIFDRRLMRTGPRATPGRFRTRVITSGVTPSLHVDYKHATIKQYHKEGRALRTETTINDTRDFRIGKRLTNLPALREVGFSANRRLLRLATTQPRPDHRSRSHHRRHRPRPHRRRNPHPRPAPGPAPQPRAARRAADLPAASPAASPTATCATSPPTPRPARRQHRADHLRPAPAPQPPAHRAHPAHPPLPRHRHRPAHRHVPHPPARPRPARRPRPLTATSAPPGMLRAAAAAYQAAIDDLIRDAGLAA